MPNSPFRRPPSSVVSFTSTTDQVVRLPLSECIEESTEDILKVAKDDLSRLRLKEHRKRVTKRLVQHCSNGITLLMYHIIYSRKHNCTLFWYTP